MSLHLNDHLVLKMVYLVDLLFIDHESPPSTKKHPVPRATIIQCPALPDTQFRALGASSKPGHGAKAKLQPQWIRTAAAWENED